MGDLGSDFRGKFRGEFPRKGEILLFGRDFHDGNLAVPL
jgi:hypothetical protein